MLKDCLLDWHMWPTYLIGLSWTIPNVSSTAQSNSQQFAANGNL
jgi:hypothetical protein